MTNVSFILPAYKRRFLREAIASILAQTYRDFELVVVDDCSPEDLKSVVEEFHDERVSYHRNTTNLGSRDLVSAWEHAIEFARAEWCILASDDDIYLPNCLSDLVALQKKYPKCDLFHARNVEIDASGAWRHLTPARVEFESQIVFSQVRVIGRDQRAPDFMFRRAALENVGGFVKFPLAWHTDDATWMLMSRNGCAHTRDVAFCFRMSGVNITSANDMAAKDKICAGELFRRWYCDFVRELVPATAEERYILANMASRGMSEISWLEDSTLTNVKSTRIWLSLLRTYPRKLLAKGSLVCKRYPRFSALKMMLFR